MSSIWQIVEPTAIMAAAVLLAVLGLVIVRRAPTFEQHFTENEVAGLLFSAMGVVYGALLAFVVFAVWQTYAGAQQAVTQEAAAAIAAYRDTQEFPAPQRAEAQADLRAYVGEVMANEWLTMPGMDMSSPPGTAAPAGSAAMSMEPSTAPAIATPSATTSAPSASPMAAASSSGFPAAGSPSPSAAMVTPGPSMAMGATPSASMASKPTPAASMPMRASPSAAVTRTPKPSMAMASASASPSMAMASASPSMAMASASASMAMESPSPSPSPAVVAPPTSSAIAPSPSPSMAMGNTPDPLNALWAVYRSLPAASSAQDTALSGLELNSMDERLHALELQRHLRHLSGESTLPWIFWPLLLMGGVIVVGFTYFFHQDSHVSQALMTGVVTALLSGVLLLIFALNQPFNGPVPVSKQPFEHALAEFQLIDEGP